MFYSTQEKMPVTSFLYAKVCKRNCRWQVRCIWIKYLNIIYNYNKIADLNKIKRIIQIKLSKIYKKVLTNANVNAIIMTSKEKRNKKRKSFNS